MIYIEFDDNISIHRNLNDISVRISLSDDRPDVYLVNQNLDNYDLIIDFEYGSHVSIHYFNDFYYLTLDDMFECKIKTDKLMITTEL